MKYTGTIAVEFTIDGSNFESPEELRNYISDVLKRRLTNEGQIYKYAPVIETLELTIQE